MTTNLHYRNLYERIGYRFKNEELLLHALTRTAYARENNLPMEHTMDCLAVLGDAVLDILVIRKLMEEGEYEKGEITRRKIDMVNMTVVRGFAEQIGLPEFMMWGKGEERMTIWTSGRVSAECFEALMGAAYLDDGIEAPAAILRQVGGI
jgi:ribonuclease III